MFSRIEGQVVAVKVGNRKINGPNFPIIVAFCAIPRKDMNILSLSFINKLDMVHYPEKGIFTSGSFVVNPRTHNIVQVNKYAKISVEITQPVKS